MGMTEFGPGLLYHMNMLEHRIFAMGSLSRLYGMMGPLA